MIQPRKKLDPFEKKEEAEDYLRRLPDRLAKFSLRLAEEKSALVKFNRWESAKDVDDRIGHRSLVRQVAGESLDKLQRVLLAMMREMQVDHRGAERRR